MRSQKPMLRAPGILPHRHPPYPRTMEATSAGDPFHHSTPNSPQTAPREIPPPLPNHAAPRPLPSQTEIISSNSRIQPGRLLPERKSASRNTPQPSNAISAPNALPAPITSAPIYAPTPTNAPSSAPSAAKRSPANTIANATRVCTRARRNSSAAASSAQAGAGAADGASRAPTPWAGISGARQGGYASSPCWMKRRWSARDSSTSR